MNSRMMQQLNLPTIPEAWHDSHEFDTRAKCWPGTRERVVRNLVEWTEGESTKTKPMLWLNGPMGTGKSTIALTVTQKLLDSGRLLASYFFSKRGGTERNRISRLFPTLAWQMASTIPQFRDALYRSLGNIQKDEIEKKSLRRQFEILFEIPLESASKALLGSLRNVLVVDALDECEDLGRAGTELGRKLLDDALDLLSKLCSSNNLALHILLTSRADPYFRKPIQVRNFIQPFDLDGQDLLDETKKDMGTFIRGKFKKIAETEDLESWPVAADLKRLIESANKPEPLFIYAATLFLFIEGRPDQKVYPKKQLKKWLAQSGSSTSRFGQIYRPVLDQALGSPGSEDYDVDEHDQLNLLLGTLCLLEQDLTQSEIAALLRWESDDVGQWIVSLHAVLDVEDSTKAIRLRHKSFNDFLLDKSSMEYHVVATKTHTDLAQLCILRMQDGLKRDICDINKLDLQSEDIDDDLFYACIPADLAYACTNWAHHLVHGDRQALNTAWDFLEEHFLHWVEVMSLLGLAPRTVPAVAALLDAAQVSPSRSILGWSRTDTLLRDARRQTRSL